MSYEHIALTRADGVVTLTFNRPESRNSMTPAMGEEVVRAVRELSNDSEARVVVLTGAGKAFSSGGDLSMLARDAGLSDAGASMGGSPRDFYNQYLTIRQLPMPTIAAINGHAIGAGLCIALACDMRIASADAKMGMTFSKLGIHPGMGGTFTLPRLVGTARACELFFTGRIIDAAEAERMGMLNRVVPREEFQGTVDALAREVAAAAPIVCRMLKKSIYRGVEHGLDEMLDYESLNQGITFKTEDAKEGIRAVQEKRAPRFTGR
jgi:enoyl-CoA hydratase